VLFQAVATAGGSGSGVAMALLQHRGGQLKNLFPSSLIRSNLSAIEFWNDASISDTAVFSVADFVWNIGVEGHYGPHRYNISTYTFNAQSSRYSLRDAFSTENKYADPSTVLTSEMSQIISHSR
jgi:hypothetical protein